jgi:hypothetical protein
MDTDISTKQSSDLVKTNGKPYESLNAWTGKRLLTAIQFFPAANITEEAKEGFIREWKVIVAEVGQEQFDEALTEHIRECKFFPTVAELRERAGLKKLDALAVEAEHHWQRTKAFVEKNYYKDLGGLNGADKIPPRAAYAMRAVGGPAAIYFMELEAEPFKKRDFIEAYRLAPLAEHMKAVGLLDIVSDHKTLGAGGDQ